MAHIPRLRRKSAFEGVGGGLATGSCSMPMAPMARGATADLDGRAKDSDPWSPQEFMGKKPSLEWGRKGSREFRDGGAWGKQGSREFSEPLGMNGSGELTRKGSREGNNPFQHVLSPTSPGKLTRKGSRDTNNPFQHVLSPTSPKGNFAATTASLHGFHNEDEEKWHNQDSQASDSTKKKPQDKEPKMMPGLKGMPKNRPKTDAEMLEELLRGDKPDDKVRGGTKESTFGAQNSHTSNASSVSRLSRGSKAAELPTKLGVTFDCAEEAPNGSPQEGDTSTTLAPSQSRRSLVQPQRPSMMYAESARAKIQRELERAEEDAERRNARKSLRTMVRTTTTALELMLKKQNASATGHWIHSGAASLIFAFAIIANSAFLGVETDYRDEDDMSSWSTWFAFESVFCSIFTIELGLRFKADKLQTLKDWWNCFDLLLVSEGIITTWITPLALSSKRNMSETQNLSTLRMLRMLRMLRILRLFRYSHNLRLLAEGIAGAMKALVYAVIFIIVILYICSILVTSYISPDDGNNEEQRELLDMWFGSVSRSLFTLFQLMSLENWPRIVRMTMKVYPVCWIFFIPFMCFTNYTLLNLVTAVVVENVLVISQKEQLAEAKREEQRRFDHMRNLKRLFEEMDQDGNGDLSIEEFHEAMEDPDVVARFNQLEIAQYEAEDLFYLLDLDGSGSISVDEFVEGCLRVRGDAKAKHLLAVQYDLHNCWNDTRVGVEQVMLFIDEMRMDLFEKIDAKLAAHGLVVSEAPTQFGDDNSSVNSGSDSQGIKTPPPGEVVKVIPIDTKPSEEADARNAGIPLDKAANVEGSDEDAEDTKSQTVNQLEQEVKQLLATATHNTEEGGPLPSTSSEQSIGSSSSKQPNSRSVAAHKRGSTDTSQRGSLERDGTGSRSSISTSQRKFQKPEGVVGVGLGSQRMQTSKKPTQSPSGETTSIKLTLPTDARRSQLGGRTARKNVFSELKKNDSDAKDQKSGSRDNLDSARKARSSTGGGPAPPDDHSQASDPPDDETEESKDRKAKATPTTASRGVRNSTKEGSEKEEEKDKENLKDDAKDGIRPLELQSPSPKNGAGKEFNQELAKRRRSQSVCEVTQIEEQLKQKEKVKEQGATMTRRTSHQYGGVQPLADVSQLRTMKGPSGKASGKQPASPEGAKLVDKLSNWSKSFDRNMDEIKDEVQDARIELDDLRVALDDSENRMERVLEELKGLEDLVRERLSLPSGNEE